jgi:hypothetical protein
MPAMGRTEFEDGMRSMVDAGIAIYERELVEEIGLERFLEKAGVDIVHSDNVWVEFFFFQANCRSA